MVIKDIFHLLFRPYSFFRQKKTINDAVVYQIVLTVVMVVISGIYSALTTTSLLKDPKFYLEIFAAFGMWVLVTDGIMLITYAYTLLFKKGCLLSQQYIMVIYALTPFYLLFGLPYVKYLSILPTIAYLVIGSEVALGIKKIKAILMYAFPLIILLLMAGIAFIMVLPHLGVSY